MKFPIYEYQISSENDGVFAVSVVEGPAIKSKFVMYSKENEGSVYFLNEGPEERIITGPALIPDILIYRRDKTGYEYYTRLSKEVIKETSIKFFKEGNQNNATLNHKNKVQGLTYFESWIINDVNNDKSSTLGLKDLSVGTWMLSAKVHDEALWQEIKNGNFDGFSIEAYYDTVLVTQRKQKKEQTYMSKNIIQKIMSFLADEEVKFTEAKLEDGTMINIDNTTMEVSTVNEDGSLTPLTDGEYTLDSGEKLIVKDGKKVETAPADPATEAASEEPTPEVKQEIIDLVLEDGTVISVDADTLVVTKKEDGTPLEDGHYTLDTGEEFDVVNGLLVLPEVDATKAEQVKVEQAKVKLGLIKKDNTVELEKIMQSLEDKSKKIVELEAKIKVLENKPAVEKTELNKHNENKKTTVADNIINMYVRNGIVK